MGLIEDLSKTATLKGAQPGDALILIGEARGHLGAGLYARVWLGLKGDDLGPPPPVDLAIEKKNAGFIRSLINAGLVNAVHDVSDGGIACAAAEMALAGGIGVRLVGNREPEDTRDEACLFGEASDGGHGLAVRERLHGIVGERRHRAVVVARDEEVRDPRELTDAFAELSQAVGRHVAKLSLRSRHRAG